MRKPSDWENTKGVGQSFKRLPVGGYVCKVMKANENSVKGKEVLEVYFDIAEGDYAGFYKESYDSDTRKEKKWNGLYTVFLKKKDGSTNPFFKSFITSIEESNGIQFNWNVDQLKGLLFGGVFYGREYTKNDGSVGKIVEVHHAQSVDSIRKGDYTVPELEQAKASASTPKETAPDGFYPVIDDEVEDDLPF